MAVRYKITLTKEERGELKAMTRSGKIPAKKFMHARALLLCDAGEHGDPWKVADVATALWRHFPHDRTFEEAFR